MSWDNLIIPFFIGGTSRSIASTTLLPMNVVRMRLQMKTYTKSEMVSKNLSYRATNTRQEIVYKGMTDAFVKIYKNEGILAFYKGFTPGIIKIFPTSGIFFLTYELCLGHLN